MTRNAINCGVYHVAASLSSYLPVDLPKNNAISLVAKFSNHCDLGACCSGNHMITECHIVCYSLIVDSNLALIFEAMTMMQINTVCYFESWREHLHVQMCSIFNHIILFLSYFAGENDISTLPSSLSTNMFALGWTNTGNPWKWTEVSQRTNQRPEVSIWKPPHS